MEEGKLDTIILSPKEVDSAVLLVRIVLRNPSVNNVRAGGRIACLGHLLRANSYVLLKHISRTEILSFCGSVPPFREHHVGY